MNCHQILSGACNAGDRCFAIGSVEGIPFTAYAAGCNIVILASTFERVQIIPGASHGYIKVSAIDCSTDTGKIAASYENKTCIFEPTPVLQSDKHHSHFLDYRWVQTGSFVSFSHVITISWNLEGTRLLTGGSTIQLWKEKSSDKIDEESSGVKFVIGGGERENKTPTFESVEDPALWENVWSCQTAIPIYHMAFSPDGTLFATCGRNDRLVKIWYENKQVLFPTKSNHHKNNIKEEFEYNFTYVYIAHPRAVTNIAWRKTSKYMPKGSVSNMIVTSCLDNICRIWIETVLPDDGLVNMTQFDPLATQNPKFRTHRHKHRFLQRLKHMKTCFHIRRHVKNGAKYGNSPLNNLDGGFHGPIPSLPSSCSVHDFHSYGIHGTGVSPGMHFHLAASINAETDIPLVPSMQSSDSSNQSNFILHWLNNKEMHFTLQAEAILQELTKKVIEEENGNVVSISSDQAYPNKQIDGKKNKIMPMPKSGSVDDPNTEEDSNGKFQSNHNTPSGLQKNSMSNTTSYNSLSHENNQVIDQLADTLDVKIDCLLRDWHQSPDLLFSVHPIDGSYLIWLIEWLDDYYPGSFRQAQVSFSTRIPSAFPLGDAISMSTTVSLFNTGAHPLAFREIASSVKSKNLEASSEEELADSNETSTNDLLTTTKVKPSTENINDDAEQAINDHLNNISVNVSPSVSMVTKHSNGTLNLWQLTFAFKTKFTQVLSIGHVCRASGHRFRVNDITCHPVLPLLVSTSHHNLPESEKIVNSSNSQPATNKVVCTPSGFCSELILWRVDSVGPLCHSGGLSELARINSPEISAFSNVAWIPTLLPSTTLGSYSNSPSACFVASDGENLRVYQAVIDARTLLAEITSAENANILQKSCSLTSMFSNVSSTIKTQKATFNDKVKVVSQQSTARPGCIIQLDPISNAKHDWQNTQFLHVFQAQLITGGKTVSKNSPDSNRHGFLEADLDAMVDLQQNAEFEEPFYIVIIEKTLKGSTLHMWRIVISSKQQSSFPSETAMYVPDSNLTQELEDMDLGPRRMSEGNDAFNENGQPHAEAPHISITTKKVCTQELPIPEGVDLIHASPAAGHLSSSSIYPACCAPYIIVTACSDSISRFWKCEPVSSLDSDTSTNLYCWSEWKMFGKQKDSAIEISGQPLNISAAYSGRIACAYKYGKSFTRPHKGDTDSRYINLCVGIYECESSGGSEWVLEDTIHLKNVHLPRINIDHGIDLSYLHDNRVLQKKHRLNQVLHTFTHEEGRTTRSGETTPELAVKTSSSLLAVPSFSTLQSLRKSIAENGNTCPLTQKHLVQLDWVSKEDGSHILTVAVGSKIFLYTPVSSDIAQANIKAMKESRSAVRPILRKASSLAQPNFNDEIRWMKLRQIDLQTADGLPPLPMQISWVRDGLLVVAMDSEMHVYSQWKPNFAQHHSVEDIIDTRNLRDEDLRSIANETSQFRTKNAASMPLINKVSTANLQLLSNEKKKIGSLSVGNFQNTSDTPPNEDYMTDFGLFQASRIACPVLPQYHPKQLMELLNCGKIRWVKAILGHLVRCVSGSNNIELNNDEDESNRQRSWSRSRTLSISYAGDANTQMEQKGSTTQIPEELMLDYAEIPSIPPLPLWVLLNADKETSCQSNTLSESKKDYKELFEMKPSEDNLDDLLQNENDFVRGNRKLSLQEKQNISHFGPRQGQLLSRLLTHAHLPGLSSLDQMHLLALADTVATCNTDFAEKFVIDTGKTSINKETPNNVSTESLDDCGLRFLLAMKHFTYLLRCIPLNQRAQFQKHGIGLSNIVWAFHSENEIELLNIIPSYSKGDLKWSTLKDLGVGYWLKSINLLRQCVEKLAKCAYQVKQDPLDAAIYYLAMKKKSIVWGLFRSQRDEKMTAFFANNFSEDRWRKAALKNAFVLLGKQRFDHAVAFFLLANSLKDAVEVCINKLDDFQLALIIARLYEGDFELNVTSTYQKLLHEHVLGYDNDESQFDITKAHPDPFLRSIIFWILKKYQESLNTLLLNGVGSNHATYKEEDMLKAESHSTNPNVFNFYIYLRTHPLLVRQNLAISAQENKLTHVVLSGFSHSGDTSNTKNNDKQLQIEDSITSTERQLYFTTAHGHFKSGCPALALEVLNKLPLKILDSNIITSDNIYDSQNEDKIINTGTLDWSTTMPKSESVSKATDFDWSVPASGPVKYEEYQFDDMTNEEEEEEEEEATKTLQIDKSQKDPSSPLSPSSEPKIDIMAQQLKFVACLKILMEELSTLATGFEVDGGQLRYQLYVWLEKEVEALKLLCNYCNSEGDESTDMKEKDNFTSSYVISEKPTLHEILMQEKHEFEAKVLRAAKRKHWLKGNETLLRTLLSYCSLHGASGGGLASVRMELVLLLQELQQEKTQQQLLSPLPFPTTLPLLSACVAGNKTVIADPITYLQSQTMDMLQSIIHISPLPGLNANSICEIFILRDLAVALSSCIYQSLCDSESFLVINETSSGFQSPGIENIAKLNSSFQCSHLIGNTNISNNKKRKYSSDEAATVCTSPSKWPGVTNLRALLAQEKDEDIPKLNVLLLESFIATYMALTIFSLATCDCRILYRIVSQNFTNETWCIMFGGGIKKLLRKATTQNLMSSNIQKELEDTTDDNSVWNTVTSITKQRVKLNMKILGSFGSSNATNNMKEDKPTYREQFVPPEMSMLSYFLSKPHNTDTDYDSDEPYESDDEEVNEDDGLMDVNQITSKKPSKDNTEHVNPTSYSWCILRLAVIKLINKNIQDFIHVAGIELQDLPVLSPLAHEVLRTLDRWQDLALEFTISKGPIPQNFIPGCYVESSFPSLGIHKYRLLLNKENTPFISSSATGPIRRLWSCLVRKDHVQDIFIKIIFGKKLELQSKHQTNTENGTDSDEPISEKDSIRIIHKDHEAIVAFGLKNNSSGMIAIANPREVQELDISLLLESPHWFEDECDYDMLNISKDVEPTPTIGFSVIQTPEQTPYGSNLHSEASLTNQSSVQSGRGTALVIKHKVDNVKRISSHPLMPLYLTGGQDGSVQIWEWGHQQAVCTPRPSGTFAKVTRCRFSEQGNKFGIGDGDGNLSLWQANITSQNNRPFFTYQCHNKILSDFVFLGSCSLLATAGYSSENKNINIWDTLLPHKKSCVSAFTCHDQGASSLVFAPQHQLLISCGKKGDVCIFDVRQRTLKHRFQAHDNTIKCIALDPHEEFFATGSIEGDIKIWSLNQYYLVNTYLGEHAKNSFFKHVGQGVSQIHIDAYGRLFSCGSDGCVKVRQLIEKETIVQSLY